MPKTQEEKDKEKAEKDYSDKKDSLFAFKEKHKMRSDGLKDIARDIEKRGINHEGGLKGEIQDKLKMLKELEADRNANPEVAEEHKNKYKTIIEELEKEL